ncbi:MAG: cysteine--tRNA ligase [bacterium]
MEGIFRGIKLYDDFTRTKRDFMPLEGNRVKMYVCGVTVYDSCHLGHARSYITFDVIRRYLEYRGYEVTHIQNFTDIDDKIIRRANEQNRTTSELAEQYINEYFQVMDELHIRRATLYPRATEYIEDMIEIISSLINNNYAYAGNGDVFFNIENFPQYGALSNKGKDALEEQTEETIEGKRRREDFALWKKAKPGEPYWDSPWGHGRPGWHIECTAMALKQLGTTVDIHGGGLDLLFPHHENEIAQSEAFTGKKFANFWVHNGILQIDQEKMSKSKGNFFLIKNSLENYSADTLRMFFLNAHYRAPINFSTETLEGAREALDRFHAFFNTFDTILRCPQELQTISEQDMCHYDPEKVILEKAMAEAEQGFQKAMDDDFNTPEALATVYGLVRAGNTFAAKMASSGRGACCELIRNSLRQAKNMVITLGNVLGLFDEDPTVRFDGCRKMMEDLIDSFLTVRRLARDKKDWEIADRIRTELEDLGVTIEDRPLGTTWRIKR